MFVLFQRLASSCVILKPFHHICSGKDGIWRTPYFSQPNLERYVRHLNDLISRTKWREFLFSFRFFFLLIIITIFPHFMGKNPLTSRWNILKFLDMVDMYLKLCKRVSKCLALRLALRLAHGLLNFVETIF